MNVITLYQPHASLVMAGIKTWETRGNPPNGDMRPEGVRGLRMNNRDYREAYEAAVKQERTDDAGVTVHVTQIEEEP